MISQDINRYINNLLFISAPTLKTKDSVLMTGIYNKIVSPWVLDKEINLMGKYEILYFKRKDLIKRIKRDIGKTSSLSLDTASAISKYKSDLISLTNEVKLNHLENKEKILKICQITPGKIQKALKRNFVGQSVILNSFAKKVMRDLELSTKPQNNSLQNS